MKKGRAVTNTESKGKRPSALELVVILSGVVTAIGALHWRLKSSILSNYDIPLRRTY
jgi:hypothetical protein